MVGRCIARASAAVLAATLLCRSCAAASVTVDGKTQKDAAAVERAKADSARQMAARKKQHEEGKDGDWKTKKNEDGRVVQELKIEAPSMTEEDQYGYIMPEKYKCDSCKAVMYHLLFDLRQKHPKSRRMKQWEYTDVFDETCKGTKSFQGYGIKLIDGENTLSGPGLMANEAKIAPGSGAIQMGGDSWTKRLAEICRKIVYEKVGEDELYDIFYKKIREEADGADSAKTDSAVFEALCTKDTRDCRVGPRPPPRPRPDEEAKPKKNVKIPVKKVDDKKKSKKEKKEKKAEKAATKLPDKPAEKPANAPVASAATTPGTRIDVQTYLRSLAVKHGLTSDEYLTARTEKEWEKLTLAVAGRIFSRHGDEEL